MRFTRLGMNVQVLLIVAAPIIPAGGVDAERALELRRDRPLVQDVDPRHVGHVHVARVTAPTHVGLKTNESSGSNKAYFSYCARTSSSRQNVLDPFGPPSARAGARSPKRRSGNVMSANELLE